MRKYEESHPWLTFNLDLNRISHNTWINLGEIKSKCEHIARTPLDPGNARKMHILFLAKGVKGTTAIEGNTLSEQEVMDKIEGKLELPPSKEYLGREIDNIVSACNSISETLLQGSPPDISCDTLLEFNRLVLNGLEVEEGIIPGQIRGYSVGVAGARYRGAPAEDCEYLMERLCSWLNQDFNIAIEDDTIIYGVLKAIISHLYIAWIHPFGDGNGRTARLLEFQILLASGMPTPAAHLLSNYYNETRQEYYRQLEKTSRTGGNIIPFIEYAITGLLEGLKKQLELITRHVFDVSWENYIH
jgi:Fic family protein